MILVSYLRYCSNYRGSYLTIYIIEEYMRISVMLIDLQINKYIDNCILRK